MTFKKGDKVRYIGHWVDGEEGKKRHRPDCHSYPPLGTVGEVVERNPYGDETPIWLIQWPKGTLKRDKSEDGKKDRSDIFEYALEFAVGGEEPDEPEPACNPTFEELTGFGEECV